MKGKISSVSEKQKFAKTGEITAYIATWAKIAFQNIIRLLLMSSWCNIQILFHFSASHVVSVLLFSVFYESWLSFSFDSTPKTKIKMLDVWIKAPIQTVSWGTLEEGQRLIECRSGYKMWNGRYASNQSCEIGWAGLPKMIIFYLLKSFWSFKASFVSDKNLLQTDLVA